MRRSHLLLVSILVAVVALCVSATLFTQGGTLWKIVMTKKVDLVPLRGFTDSIKGCIETSAPILPQLLGWSRVHRWTGRLIYSVGFYPDTGIKALEAQFSEGHLSMLTVWRADGRVLAQMNAPRGVGTLETKVTAPWLWGVKDQTEPTAPWWGKE